MEAKQLVGKLALRTEVATYPNGVQDHSYVGGTPIRILFADDTHIVYQSSYSDSESVLGKEWCDNNWRDCTGMLRKAKVMKFLLKVFRLNNS